MSLRIRIAAAATAVAALAVGGALPVQPVAASAFPGTNGKIAFARDTGTPAIYVMNADGSKPHQIAPSGADAPTPSWSADGKHLVYVAVQGTNAEIFVTDARGKRRQQLTKNKLTDGAPTWSPDGTQIVFTRYGKNLDLWVMDADGSHQRNLTNTPAADEDEATWSPDGTQILFTSDPNDGSGPSEIFAMSADGSGAHALTTNGGASSASWAPDGTKIAYQAPAGADLPHIFVMNADGSNPVNLTGTEDIFFSPSWSPDGTRILFHTARLDSALDSQIYVMEADGSNPTALTEQPGTIDRHPSWQPIPAH